MNNSYLGEVNVIESELYFTNKVWEIIETVILKYIFRINDNFNEFLKFDVF